MEDEEKCPICEGVFKPDDECATDIEMGVCHFECLDGSPVVNLETGELTDGPMSKYLFKEASP